jgi:2,4-dienoyl-CoA reductase-like NADH-dependent reductase (Old Yellow Enzyme family)
MVIRKDSIVFTPARIGQLEIKNRLVHSATHESATISKGEVSDYLVDLYRTLAKGGVGLIITTIAGVYSKAFAPNILLRVDNDDFITSLQKIPQAAGWWQPGPAPGHLTGTTTDPKKSIEGYEVLYANQ